MIKKHIDLIYFSEWLDWKPTPFEEVGSEQLLINSDASMHVQTLVQAFTESEMHRNQGW